MMRIVLVDDELPVLGELAYQLSKFEEVEVVAQYTDPLKALKEIVSLQPDAVFLDIDMPVLNGLGMATELLEQKIQIPVVFVTAYNQYALQAFEVNAIDYVVKPVRSDRLKHTVEKLQQTIGTRASANDQLQQIRDLKNALHKAPDRLIIFDGEQYHFVRYDEILYIEAQAKISAIVTDKAVYTTKKTMYDLEEQLRNHGFVRCHRSYIINTLHLTKIMPTNSGTFQLQLQQTSLIPVSKSYTAEIKKLIEHMG